MVRHLFLFLGAKYGIFLGISKGIILNLKGVFPKPE